MTNSHWTRARMAGLVGLAALSLAACGGGGGGGGFFPIAGPVAGNPGTPANPDTPPVALQPLAGGSQYAGTASFGDTVSITLDQPAAGQLTLRFVDSRFGLAGALSASYATQPDGSLLATKFAAVAGTGVPDALTAALPKLSLRFHVDGALLSGSLAQVPNLKAADGSLLQGEVAASNQGAADVARLAGVYSFIKRTTAYNAKGVAQGAAAAEFGQLNIKADGSVRACVGQAYADNCSAGQPGKLAAEADQKTYPGALALTIDGQRIGRVMVNAQSGAAMLLADEFTSAADGSFRTGTWVLQSAAVALPATALDGEWLCSQPELDAKTGAATGRTQRNFVSVGTGLLQTDTIDTDVKLSANAGIGGASTSAVSGMNGLVAGQWSDSQKAGRVLLPVGKQTAYYIGTGASTGAAAGSNISGVCRALPVQPVINTYAAAAFNVPMAIRIGDARPTQPAIGYDQVYYKQARYRNTAVAKEWMKEFADFCEAAGLSDVDNNTVSSNSVLNNPATFTCTGNVNALDITAMKSAVVGPRGVLYLTDGHHTLTSFWEAPNGGGADVKVPVVMKGNFMSQNNATFWRGMRANKTVWLKQPDGRAITPAELPQQLGLSNGLQDDPYRALLYFTRDVGYKQPADSTEFLEFYWSEWLQAAPQNLKLSAYTLTNASSYLQAITDASNLMIATPGDTIIGSSGKTALQMGKLASFSTKDFKALSVPVTDAKPGKLAYALYYRALLAAK
ncbi:ParB/Srx family N-terminal domain-containing protein [Variovorax sp. EL159]|uniref:ParB/Srx family N-terminal domain-containing protein n=1 Tax=Variovorax sp. EL159 TaxID=1566270 RepID=UPI000884790D|nr:ParB/Srx family N-terminal domain-containing protein [Variovorax sp. EL159]SCX73352.1 Putative ParB-like nuclease [Variovorax sp. EL159]